MLMYTLLLNKYNLIVKKKKDIVQIHYDKQIILENVINEMLKCGRSIA